MNQHSRLGLGSLRWLVLAFLWMMAVTDHGKAASVKCQAGAIETEIMVHERDGTVSTIGPEKLAATEASFQAFVSAVLDQLPVLLETAGFCAADAERVMQAQFVHVPLIADAFTPFEYDTEVPQEAACHVTSPWVHISDVPNRRPRLKARFSWNERQVLFDQAVLLGAPADQIALEPFSKKAFSELYWMYFKEEVEGLSPPSGAPPIEFRIPPDLFWLFRKSGWLNLAPIDGPLIRAMSAFKRAVSLQETLNRELISVCLYPFSRQHVFRTIRDTAGLFARHLYVIDTILEP